MIESIETTRLRESFRVYDVLSCRVRDVNRALLRYEPTILHFSGHGSREGIYLENESDRATSFKLETWPTSLVIIRDVILNCCYSADQAQAIAEIVGCTIAMSGEIWNRDAICFTRDFYTALGYGRSFRVAFDIARKLVRLEGGNMDARFHTRQGN